ncbi:hypothetical protein K438DRAFT_1774599 [Mycena galopus ATCC 62051]|nr:hypothetical protein K438DRAFT_1774599 [Mycena galopus ATCC 62051]
MHLKLLAPADVFGLFMQTVALSLERQAEICCLPQGYPCEVVTVVDPGPGIKCCEPYFCYGNSGGTEVGDKFGRGALRSGVTRTNEHLNRQRKSNKGSARYYYRCVEIKESNSNFLNLVIQQERGGHEAPLRSKNGRPVTLVKIARSRQAAPNDRRP